MGRGKLARHLGIPPASLALRSPSCMASVSCLGLTSLYSLFQPLASGCFLLLRKSLLSPAVGPLHPLSAPRHHPLHLVGSCAVFRCVRGLSYRARTVGMLSLRCVPLYGTPQFVLNIHLCDNPAMLPSLPSALQAPRGEVL